MESLVAFNKKEMDLGKFYEKTKRIKLRHHILLTSAKRDHAVGLFLFQLIQNIYFRKPIL